MEESRVREIVREVVDSRNQLKEAQEQIKKLERESAERVAKIEKEKNLEIEKPRQN